MPNASQAHPHADRVSFEFFPPKTDEMHAQLFNTARALKAFNPSFVSVTYGAGGSTRDTTLSTVRDLINGEGLAAASHLTCVAATRAEVAEVVRDLKKAGVNHIVALRGDPQGGIGTRYTPHPDGFANAAELVAGLKQMGDFEISVSAYPEKHPESADFSADIDNLKQKADAGATRAITQFFFDNDAFARYLERVLAAGIAIPVVPGILPVHNIAQVKRFASLCGASVPAYVEELLENDDAQCSRAAALAASQIEGLRALGIEEFHFYTMNRSALTSTVLRLAGFDEAPETAIALAAE